MRENSRAKFQKNAGRLIAVTIPSLSSQSERVKKHYPLVWYTAISIKVVGSFQAYATRPKGSVGSCKYVLVSRSSAVGQELQIS